LQFVRRATDLGRLNPALQSRAAATILGNMWSGVPARVRAYVDGTDDSEKSWDYASQSTIAFAAHADAPLGRAEIFDYARSLIFSSYLSRYGVNADHGTASPVEAYAIALLALHCPDRFRSDSRWSRVAGASDTRVERRGGVRFYTTDWSSPLMRERGGLTLMSRVATAANANVLLDLPEASRAVPTVMSITYSATTNGEVQQWDGARYQTIARLPASFDEMGNLRWWRTSWLILPASATDYQPSAPGRNVLFQFTSKPVIHRLEATPLQ
jgi:hypothetical protein